jgi:hypothetical protein
VTLSLLERAPCLTDELATRLATTVAGTFAGPVASLTRPVTRRVRSVEKALARNPLTRMLAAVPETTGFAVRTVQRQLRGDTVPGLPATRVTPRLLGYVALDEAILTLAKGPERFPRRADYERVREELTVAHDVFAARGWIDDPASYHVTPPPLEPGDVQVTRGWAQGMRYERIHFASGYEPHEGEPGRDRWLGFHTNRTASAWVLRHDDDVERPWLVCVHGMGMGEAFMAFPAFHVAHLHHDLGINLIGPTLPLHGARKVGALSGDDFLSFDVMNGVHGLTQSLWDVRRVLSWVRAQQPAPTAVGVSGISLGGYVTSLVAGFEPALDAAIVGIPVSDFPALLETHSPTVIRQRATEHGIIGDRADAVYRVVSPLAITPVVPPAGRFIFAGLADRLSHPRQAHNLWQHWGEPGIQWYPGNHVGYLWSSRVSEFVESSLKERGIFREVP